MIIEVKGEIDLRPSILETSLENSLDKHDITLGDASQLEGTLFGNPATIHPPFLFIRRSAEKSPRVEYSLQLYGRTKDSYDSKNINQFVNKLNKKKYHVERIQFHLGDYRYLVSNFRGHAFKYFIIDDCEEFAIPFMQNALKNYFKTSKTLPSDFGFYDSDKIINYVAEEKRARSPPSQRDFTPQGVSMDLVNMLVDQFVREIRYNQPS